MRDKLQFDVIIIGGSYSGLAASLALGRALRNVLIIDNGMPCNGQTPHSHNFLTQDGKTPFEISTNAKEQVLKYNTVKVINDLAIKGTKTHAGFEITTKYGKIFAAKKLIFASGIKDKMPVIEGFSECWGISILHCPFCHGYEVKGLTTGILGNGENGFELAKLIFNWTKDITIFTNEKAVFNPEQSKLLARFNIKIDELEIQKIEHISGSIKNIQFRDNAKTQLNTLYARLPFTQNCTIIEQLGCEITTDGFIYIDNLQKTTVPGVFACGDNTSRIRTIANAVSMGTTTGIMVNKELIEDEFTL